MANQQQNLFRFNRDLEAFSARMGIDHVVVMKKISFDLFRRIVMKTPADTGRARASWTIAIDRPDRSVAAPGIHPDLQGAAPSPGAGDTAASGISGVLAQLKPGEYRPIWISNNLPYIEPLETGHSKQAPSGMVGLSIIETQLEIDTALEVRS